MEIVRNWMEVVMGGKMKWSSHLCDVMKSDVNVAAKGKVCLTSSSGL